MDIISVLCITYLILSSTIGAWWMASMDVSEEKDHITLFVILCNILPAVLFSWILFPLVLANKIKIKKFK
jgi:hypothetical protein